MDSIHQECRAESGGDGHPPGFSAWAMLTIVAPLALELLATAVAALLEAAAERAAEALSGNGSGKPDAGGTTFRA